MHTELTLKNGLKTVLVPVKDAKSLTMYKIYSVGSRYETDEIAGAAHFIEHMLFKGTTKRPTPRDISVELDAIGAQYNAWTSKDATAYYIKVPKDKFEVACDVLSDMSYNATFPTEEFDREKGVIIEEIKMIADTPIRYAMDILEEEMYAGNSLERHIIGTAQTITGMEREQLLNFKSSFYNDDRSILVIAGFIPDDAEEVLNRYFTSDEKTAGDYETDFAPYYLTQDAPRVRVLTKDIEGVHLAAGFSCKGLDGEDEFVYEVLCAHLGGGMSSVLFDEIREKRGLAYYVMMFPDLYKEIGSLVIRAGLNKAQLPEALALIQSILTELGEKGLEDGDLRKAKDYLIGNMMLDEEDSAHLAQMYAREYAVTGRLVSPEERIQGIKKVTKDDIMRVAREIFVPRRLTLAIIGKDLDEKEIQSYLTL